MIIGFDMDGVITKAPLGFHKLLRYYQNGWDGSLFSHLGASIYGKLRYVDKQTKEAVVHLHSVGHQIIIITFAARGGHRTTVEQWLRGKGVLFDRIVEVQKGESPIDYKARAILEQKCDYYIEDQSGLARVIALKVPEVKVIHYRRKEDLQILFD